MTADQDLVKNQAEQLRERFTWMFQPLNTAANVLSEYTGELGATPKETIFARGTLKLHHYYPHCDEVYRVPVLIVTSLVNQPYILDLAPGQSLVEYLLRHGFDVYLIEWGVPRREHQHLRLEDFVLELIPQCIDQVREDCGEADISLLGYCIGGLLSVLYAALHTDGPLKNLVCVAAPVNGHGLEALKQWMGPGHFDEELLIERHGNIPADIVQDTLRMLRPLGKMAGDLNLLNNLDKADFVTSNLRFSKWETDNIPFPAATFKQLVNDFLRENKLVRKEWMIGQQRVEPDRIQVPFLHLLAKSDHITPYDSSKDLVQLVGSQDKQETILKGGHVGLVAGRNAVTQMWPALEQWLAPRSI